MNPEHCYGLCCKYYGKVVRIHDVNGNMHIGRIVDVTDNSVWLEPVDSRTFDRGFGYGGYDGFGPGYGYEYDYYYGEVAAFELAFGFIIGITLAALLFF